MLRKILDELRNHAPFTGLGALTGIILVVFFQKLPYDVSYNAFYTLHPLHVLLSALVTVAIETPANSAMSVIVGRPEIAPPAVGRRSSALMIINLTD